MKCLFFLCSQVWGCGWKGKELAGFPLDHQPGSLLPGGDAPKTVVFQDTGLQDWAPKNRPAWL